MVGNDYNALMQSVTLTPHPSTPCKLIRNFEVRASRLHGVLSLDYAIEGDIGGLYIPSPCPPRHADGLWRHTCFEAFLKGPGLAGYFEFNFAPSTEWAIYRFEAYREGMTAVENAGPPAIDLRRDATGFALNARVGLNDSATVLAGTALHLALCAVIEEQGGTLSYWALQHPPGEPDFHHPNSFALRLD